MPAPEFQLFIPFTPERTDFWATRVVEVPVVTVGKDMIYVVAMSYQIDARVYRKFCLRLCCFLVVWSALYITRLNSRSNESSESCRSQHLLRRLECYCSTTIISGDVD